MSEFIEQNCTISHHGKTFESGGAVITDNYLIAYPAENGILNDWRGNKIGSYTVVSYWPAIFFGCRSHYGSHVYAMRARVGQREYSLRGFGVGMIAKGKAIRQ